MKERDPTNYSLERRAVKGPRLPRVAGAIEELQQFPHELLDVTDQDRLSQVIADLHYFESRAAQLRIASNQPTEMVLRKPDNGSNVETYKGIPVRQLTSDPSISSDNGWVVSLIPQTEEVDYEPVSKHLSLKSSKEGFIVKNIEWELPNLSYKIEMNDNVHEYWNDPNILLSLFKKEPVLCIYNRSDLTGIYRFQQYDVEKHSWVPQILKFQKIDDKAYGTHFLELGLGDNRETFLCRRMKVKEF